ncbi:MAG: hypothetical protein IJY25_05080 [Bacilli bacterium]|nr:hypothetical protein [Bacilli bacterium]
MKKYILFLIIALFTFYDVNALSYGGCDYSVISRLKSLVTNVNTTYDYHMENNTPVFDLTITNVTSDMYFVDSITDRTYYYSDTNNGEITIYGYNVSSGNLRFYSNVGECYGVKLGTKYYNFPKYNIYYNNSLCSDIPNFSLCQKWIDVNYSYSEFKKLVLEYKNKQIDQEEQIQVEYQKGLFDKLIEFYVNYYYIILGLIIIVCGIVIFIKSRNNKFNL